MNGYSRDARATKTEGSLFHSCTWEGLSDLLLNFDSEYPLCCSTEKSSRLFGRPVVLVFRAKERDTMYTPFDADAGRDYGWDEARVRFSSAEELVGELEHIVVAPGEMEAAESADWKWDIIEAHYSIFMESSDKFYNF